MYLIVFYRMQNNLRPDMHGSRTRRKDKRGRDEINKWNEECQLFLVLDFWRIETNASITTSDRGITDENRSQIDASDSWGPPKLSHCNLHARIHFICTTTGTATAATWCYSSPLLPHWLTFPFPFPFPFPFTFPLSWIRRNDNQTMVCPVAHPSKEILDGDTWNHRMC